MGTLKRRWIESMEPTEEPPMEQERLQPADSGYTAGISAGADLKPTLTDVEREAVEWASLVLRNMAEERDQVGDYCRRLNEAAALMLNLLQRLK
jgi:hypothetical protein